MTKTMNKKTERSSALNSEKNESILSFYIKEIKRIPLLDKEEERELAIEALKGNKQAKGKLASANLRFVITIAKKHQGLGLSLEDLISEGNVGLLWAIERYRIDKGCRFISYAAWWIRHFVQQAIFEKARIIHVPQHKLATLNRIDTVRKTFLNDSQSVEETAKVMEMTKDEVTELMALNQDVLYFGSPIRRENKTITVEDFIEDKNNKKPEDAALERLLKQDLDAIIACLGKREAHIIRARYGLDGEGTMSLEEIGRIYNISKEYVRQVENKVIRQLQEQSLNYRLDTYVA